MRGAVSGLIEGGNFRRFKQERGVGVRSAGLRLGREGRGTGSGSTRKTSRLERRYDPDQRSLRVTCGLNLTFGGKETQKLKVPSLERE